MARRTELASRAPLTECTWRLERRGSASAPSERELDRAEGRVHDERGDEDDVRGHVAAVTADQLRDRRNVLRPCQRTELPQAPLRAGTDEGRVGGEDGGPRTQDCFMPRKERAMAASRVPDPAQGHAAAVLPGGEVVAAEAGAEDEVLEEEDDAEGDGPVAEHAEQVLEDVLDLVTPAQGQAEHDHRHERAPDGARHGDEVLAPELGAQRGRVEVGDEVADCAEALR